MAISTLGAPFRGAGKIHDLTLQALVEVCSPLDSFVVHLNFATSEPHHCLIHSMFDFPISVSC